MNKMVDISIIHFVNIINYAKLEILGIHETYIYYGMILFVFAICYYVFKPIIAWLVFHQTTKLLTYCFSSLLLIIMIFTIFHLDIFAFIKNVELIVILKVALQVISLFGLTVAIYQYTKYVLQIK